MDMQYLNKLLGRQGYSLIAELVYLLELDRVYPNSKTRQVLAIFPNPNLRKNPISRDCQNPNSKKTRNLKLDQIQFSTIDNFAKKDAFWPNFGQNFLSFNPVNSKNLTSFELISLNPKNLNSKMFGILKPEKLKPETQRGNSNPK